MPLAHVEDWPLQGELLLHGSPYGNYQSTALKLSCTFSTLIYSNQLTEWGIEEENRSCIHLREQTECFSQEMHEKDTVSFLAKPNLKRETVQADQYAGTVCEDKYTEMEMDWVCPVDRQQ